jgi:hypothetical protein
LPGASADPRIENGKNCRESPNFAMQPGTSKNARLYPTSGAALRARKMNLVAEIAPFCYFVDAFDQIRL